MACPSVVAVVESFLDSADMAAWHNRTYYILTSISVHGILQYKCKIDLKQPGKHIAMALNASSTLMIWPKVRFWSPLDLAHTINLRKFLVVVKASCSEDRN